MLAAHHQLGRLGERVAARYLERNGYRIVERNYRTREGEIDIIAVRRPSLVFCEVKTLRVRAVAGSGPVYPLESVRQAKRVQIRRIARSWLADAEASSSRPPCRDIRFDAIGVLLSAAGDVLSLDHVESAF